MDLSIVIVNWNTKDLLNDCLISIYQETKDIHFEIIVVDNGSKDGSLEILKKFPDVILIKNRRNLGYSKANNQGIAISTGRYVCLLNSDTIILDNAFKKLVYLLEKRPDIGATTCLLINPDGSPQFGSALGETDLLYMLSVETGLYKKFPKSRIWGKPFLSFLDHQTAHKLEVCPSAVIVIRKEVFDTVGLLDENIFFGTIDWDFSIRMRKKGWNLYFEPTAKVIHYGGKSKTAIKEHLLTSDYRCQYYYFWKHYGIIKMNFFRYLIILSSMIKLFLALLTHILKKDSFSLKTTKRKMNNHFIRLKVSLSVLNFKDIDTVNSKIVHLNENSSTK